jgi:hypothetical protein
MQASMKKYFTSSLPCMFKWIIYYPNKTVMEMHSEKLCRQVGIAGDMLPGDILDNLLCTWTGFLIETNLEAVS